jgi:hypothetical protein
MRAGRRFFIAIEATIRSDRRRTAALTDGGAAAVRPAGSSRPKKPSIPLSDPIP